MRSATAIVALGLLTGACATSTATAPDRSGRFTGIPAPRPVVSSGTLIGSTAPHLIRLLGRPAREITEGNAVKLQFRGADCIVDAYLYPVAGAGAPTVTHIDARHGDGRDADRAACVAHLQQGAGNSK